MKTYNILWMDDEHDGMSGLNGDAKLNGIILNPYKSLNDGISELKKNYPIYDGVLLDAKFFEYEDDVKGSEDTDNVHRAKEALLQLPKKFEVFVLTGQAEAFDDKTFKKAFKKVYKKGIDTDIEQLFSDIKDAADQLSDTQIRHEYSRVFDVCTERYIGEAAAHDLLDLLQYNGDSTDKFNQIRKIVEDLFRAFNKYGLLPNEFVHPNVALNPSSRFLCGQEQSNSTSNDLKKYKLKEDAVVPEQIAHFLRSILTITQGGSHRSKIDAHVGSLKTPYLFKSVLFQLLDVLVWFKQYIDSNPKPENWELVEWHHEIDNNWLSGQVLRIAENGWGTFKPDDSYDTISIPPKMVIENHLEETELIEVITEPSPDGSKTFIKTIKR